MAYGYAPPRDPTEVLGRRIFSYLIDIVAMAIVGLILFGTAKHATYTNAPSNACDILRARGGNILCVNVGSRVYVWQRGALLRSYGSSALLSFLNFVVLQSITGASLGKLLLGLRVVDQQGNKAGVGRMVGRWLLLFVDALCFLVGLITVLVTHPHRRVGDLACGTYVVAAGSVGQPITLYPVGAPGYGPPPGYAPAGYGAPPGWTPPSGPAPPAPSWAPPAQSAPPWAPPVQSAPPPAPSWTPGPTQPAPQSQWDAPPSTQPAQPEQPSQPPAQWGAPAPPAPPAAAPPSWSPVGPAPAPPASVPPAPAPPAATPPETTGESWWDKALTEPPEESGDEQS